MSAACKGDCDECGMPCYRPTAVKIEALLLENAQLRAEVEAYKHAALERSER